MKLINVDQKWRLDRQQKTSISTQDIALAVLFFSLILFLMGSK